MIIFKDICVVIVVIGFMGGKVVKFMYDMFCFGEDCVELGDIFEGEFRGLLDFMVGEEVVGDYVVIF